jgi:hypothetical protein
MLAAVAACADLANLVTLQAAVEEGIVIGGGCTFLKLAQKVDGIKDSLENDEQRVRPDPLLLCPHSLQA